MISNQVLQNTLEVLKEISRTEFCVIDTDFPHTGFISTENWQEKWEIRMKKLIKSRL